MYFIIFVTLLYVTTWIRKHGMNLANGMHYRERHLQQGLWGIFTHAIKGLTLGYSIWFIYYIIVNYPYPFL